MNYTSIEQSEKLLKLGVNPETADMHYPDYYFDGNANGPCNTSYKEQIENLIHNFINPNTKRIVPCWSVGALLELIPTPVLSRIDEEKEILWYCNTIHFGENYFSYDGSYHNNAIDACIEVIEWLVNNGHKLNYNE